MPVPPGRFDPTRLAQRMSLEAQLRTSIMREYGILNTDQRNAYASSSTFMSGDAFRKGMRSTIGRHYGAVGSTFGYGTVSGLRLASGAASAARLLYDEFSNARAYDSAAYTTLTVLQEIEDTYKRIASFLGVNTSLDPASNRAIAELAYAELNNRFNAKADNVATTETTLAAERLESIKADVLAGGNLADENGDPIPGANRITKIWITVGDANVRDSHRLAGLAPAIPHDQPFVVGGSFLKHPGDPTSGAALGEIIYCRCTTSYLLDGADDA